MTKEQLEALENLNKHIAMYDAQAEQGLTYEEQADSLDVIKEMADSVLTAFNIPCIIYTINDDGDYVDENGNIVEE